MSTKTLAALSISQGKTVLKYARRTSLRKSILWLLCSVLCLLCASSALAQHHGQVTFAGVPVPGATVTATQGDKKLVAITDAQGQYAFPELADGPFSIRVE